MGWGRYNFLFLYFSGFSWTGQLQMGSQTESSGTLGGEMNGPPQPRQSLKDTQYRTQDTWPHPIMLLPLGRTPGMSLPNLTASSVLDGSLPHEPAPSSMGMAPERPSLASPDPGLDHPVLRERRCYPTHTPGLT